MGGGWGGGGSSEPPELPLDPPLTRHIWVKQRSRSALHSIAGWSVYGLKVILSLNAVS